MLLAEPSRAKAAGFLPPEEHSSLKKTKFFSLKDPNLFWKSPPKIQR